MKGVNYRFKFNYFNMYFQMKSKYLIDRNNNINKII